MDAFILTDFLALSKFLNLEILALRGTFFLIKHTLKFVLSDTWRCVYIVPYNKKIPTQRASNMLGVPHLVNKSV